MKLGLKIILIISAFVGLYFFCEHQTRGFRLHAILSDIPNDPRWEISSQDNEAIQPLLNQTFTYLGKGGWCFAFLGEDQKTVLKFFRHNHLNLLSILKDFSWGKLFLYSPKISSETPFFQEFPFKSCKLIYTQAKTQAGLLYVHLNKTQGLHKNVTLIDNIGVRHTVDLDGTEFVVQQKGELVVNFLSRSIKEGRKEEAKCIIDSYFECLLTLCKKGLRDLDREFRDNFGIINDQVITLDISSFIEDPSLQNPGKYKKEIILKSHNLIRWLTKRDDALAQYAEDKLTILIQND